MAHLAVDGEYSGRILIADELKEDATDAIRLLRQQGIQTAMLTGDSQLAAITARPNKTLINSGHRADIFSIF